MCSDDYGARTYPVRRVEELAREADRARNVLDDLKTELRRVMVENAQLRQALKQKQEAEACRT